MLKLSRSFHLLMQISSALFLTADLLILRWVSAMVSRAITATARADIMAEDIMATDMEEATDMDTDMVAEAMAMEARPMATQRRLLRLHPLQKAKRSKR